jgi:NAD+ diphosphatase
MPPIRATRPNPYAGSPLDRASRLRDDAAWLRGALDDQATRWAPVWRSKNLLQCAAERQPRALMLPGAHIDAVRADHPWSFLGLGETGALFAIDLSVVDDPAALVPAAGQFADLRSVAGLLPPGEAAVLAHARGMMHWRQRNRFCANCGHPTEARHAGNATHCPACDTPHFPRTDPAVIMLVTRGDMALLGHSQRFPLATMYSTLAGFVEPGESLEEAVAREVLEETGVRVGEVSYHSSQPWPFPASVMLGFYAEALSEEIVLDRTELEDARWFSRRQVRDPEAHGFTVPRSDSIARRLIDDWLDS